MNGIMGISSLLADQELSTSEKIEYIPFLRSSINRMIGTFTDYLDISLIVSDNIVTIFKPFDINKELREVEHKYQQVCQDKNITLALHLPHNDGKFKLNSDRELFRKIVNHLVDNAVKFTNAGSVTFGYSLNGNSLGFFVEDTGIGISIEARQRIFKAFTQENTHPARDYEGSGLGLSIVSGFLKRLGGDLSLESEKGQGTALYFTLPLH
jgi:two-component system CheB/CheR fusion protein